MGIELVFFLSIVLFLISILGLLISSDAITFFISRQIMIAAAVVNFLNFSLHIVPGDSGINILLILGIMTFYLMEFSILYNIYLNTDNMDRNGLFKGSGLLSVEKSDWWGEDRI